ncbi:hypothetical protein CEXT_702621 [Caerostris extrusa]|uniref:Uncharacterized protein n=1 Tax=Caerostris extrusa TaxID=172846 RepID=A0AAV4NLF1_CAEEX|nr:hypothetical protein CEXT_702621 [Caerostris extrusa]
MEEEVAGLYHWRENTVPLSPEFVIRTTSDRWHVIRKGRKSAIRGAINIGEHKDLLCADAPCTCAHACGVSTKNAELSSPRLATYSKVSLSDAA